MAVEPNSEWDEPQSMAGRLAYTAFQALAGTLRLVLFSILSLLAPVIRIALAFIALGGLATCVIFALGPPHLHFPYRGMIFLSIICTVLRVLYDKLLLALSP